MEVTGTLHAVVYWLTGSVLSVQRIVYCELSSLIALLVETVLQCFGARSQAPVSSARQ